MNAYRVGKCKNSASGRVYLLPPRCAILSALNGKFGAFSDVTLKEEFKLPAILLGGSALHATIFRQKVEKNCSKPFSVHVKRHASSKMSVVSLGG
jgi:hypothetical protein